MEPEEEFLENASTMAYYAMQEIKQFLAWTNKQAPHGHAATDLLLKLDTLTSDIKLLKIEFKKR